MRYFFSDRAAFGIFFFLLPAVLILLLAAVFGGAAAADALPDADAATAGAFLAENGWHVDPASCETAEVLIPSEFGAVYESYNALQRSQGFDLSPLRGCAVKRVSFIVTDYPGDGVVGPIRANVLLSDGRIVAADICSAALDGFIRGVKE